MVIALIHVFSFFFKTKSAFKVFTHVQLSGSTLQKKGVNDKTDVELQIRPLTLTLMLCLRGIPQLSRDYNRSSHPTLDGYEREFKKLNDIRQIH